MVSDHAAVPQAPRRRNAGRTLLAAVLVLSTLLGVAAWWLAATTAGARVAATLAERLTPGLRINGIEGRLAGPLRIAHVSFDLPERRYEMTDLQLDWEPRALLRRHVHVRLLRAARFDMENKLDSNEPPPPLPDTLQLAPTIRIDRLQIDSGSMAPIELLGAAASLDYDGTRYLLALENLALKSAGADPLGGTFAGRATLEATRPYTLSAQITSNTHGSVVEREFGAYGDIALSGTLAEMSASLKLAVRQAAAEVRAEGHVILRPFAAVPLGASSVRVTGVDLAALRAGLPRTQLDLTLDTDAAGTGALAITNREPGTYDQARLPVRTLRTQVRQEGGKVLLEQIAAALGGAQSAGAIAGSGAFSRGTLTLDLTTTGLNLKGLDSRMRPTQLTGSAAIRTAGSRQEIGLALTEAVNRNRVELNAHGILADAVLRVDHAHVRLGQAAIEASGQIAFNGTQAFRAEVRLDRFRPGDIGDFPQLPDLLLSGSLTASGVRAPALATELAFTVTDSQLSGHPLTGEGRARLRADLLEVPKLQLVVGANRLTVQGAMSERDSQLAFTLSAPHLEQIGPDFAGTILVTGTARGALAHPRIHAEWEAARVLLPGAVRLEASQGKADLAIDRTRPFFLDTASVDATARGLQSGAQGVATLDARMRFAPQPNVPDAAIALELDAKGVRSGNRLVDSVKISASGTNASHAVDVDIAEPRQHWTIHAMGGLEGLARTPLWRGSIDRFEGTGSIAAQLAASAPLLVSQQRIQLENFRLTAQSALIAIEQFVREPGRLATRGRIERLELAKVLEIAGPAPAVTTDLVVDGEWDVSLTDTLAGSASLRRRSGDVTLVGAGTPVTLGLGALQASAAATNGRLALHLLADGRQLGHVEFAADTGMPDRANGFRIPSAAPVTGRATIKVPSIAWAGPLVSPSLIAAGQISGDLTLGGTFGDPQFGGQISGSGLRLLFADLGVDLRQGTLEGEFQGTRLRLRHLKFQSANAGTLTITGPVDLAGGKPALELTLEATHYQLLNRSDRKLVLSGASQIALAGNKVRVGGAFDIDSGTFDIGQTGTPALSDDVLIVGREDKIAGKLAVALDLRIRLGEGVTLIGRGLDALLKGEVRLLNNAGEPLQAQGTLSVGKGTFTAYGEALAIEHGLVRFTGPLDNPVLDLRAMRRAQEVAAGVSVRGTVLVPRITLVSEPNVADAEKLSWLVLGRGLGTAGSGDLTALQAAATTLLTNSAASGVSSQIATAFGLDTISVGTNNDTVQQRIVTLGKKVSSRLYVSYQKGLETASNAILVRYTLSPRLTIEAETGTRSVLSLLFNIAFD